MQYRSTTYAVLALLVAAGCADQPTAPAVPDAVPNTVALACHVDVRAATLECSAPAARAPRGTRADLLLGGQDVYVKLRSTNLVNSGGMLSADVTVKNLTAMPMATADGTTPDPNGVRVFFASGPTNGVSIANRAGTGAFTAANQEYFEYAGAELGADGILESQEISSAENWQFNLNGATTFDFTVYISTEAPSYTSVLHWREIGFGLISGSFESLWGTGSNDIFVTGASGAIYHFDGARWTAQHTGTAVSLRAVFGFASDDVYAAGDGGTILHHDGAAWTPQTTNTTFAVMDLWGPRPDALFAGSWKEVLASDGSGEWSTLGTLPNVGGYIYSIWGSAADDLIAVSTSGYIARWNGAAWTQEAAPTTQNLYDVWGTSADNVFAVGDAGTILHWDGSEWTAMEGVIHTRYLDVWGTSASDVYAAGYDGVVMHFDGTTWEQHSPSGRTQHVRAVWGESSDNLWTAGDLGSLRHYEGSKWEVVHIAYSISDLWVADANNIFATAQGSTIFHYDGSAWSIVYSVPDIYATTSINAVWGSALADIFAVGQAGRILHFDGTAWSEQPTGITQTLTDVTGSGASDVLAVGHGGTILRYDGANWETQSSGTTSNLAAVATREVGGAVTVGTGGTVMFYENGVWSVQDIGTTEYLSDVWTTGAHVYVVGGTSVWHYDGSTWSGQQVFEPVGREDLYAITGTAPGNIYAFSRGAVYHYDGTGWGRVRPQEQQPISDAEMIGAESVIAASAYGQVLQGSR